MFQRAVPESKNGHVSEQVDFGSTNDSNPDISKTAGHWRKRSAQAEAVEAKHIAVRAVAQAVWLRLCHGRRSAGCWRGTVLQGFRIPVDRSYRTSHLTFANSNTPNKIRHLNLGHNHIRLR